MAQRTLPLLFFNLGGEMLYIINQRLHAQQVLPAKAEQGEEGGGRGEEEEEEEEGGKGYGGDGAQ